jgi:hypothetical protein
MERESKLLKVNNGREREGVATSPRKKKRPFFKKGNDPILCIKVMHTTFFIKILLKSNYYKSLISQSRHMSQPLKNIT